MSERQYAFLIALSVLLIVLVVMVFKCGEEKMLIPETVNQMLDSEEISGEEPETKKVFLFFLAEEDDLLHPEVREIKADAVLTLQAKLVIRELIKGSRNGGISPIPVKTKLRELFITDEGIAFVDFSKEIQENQFFGSAGEIAAVFSIVNTLAYNFKSIKRVFILIDGREKETLGGHIDLKRPLLPRFDLAVNLPGSG
jgi:spore germination protein GerM